MPMIETISLVAAALAASGQAITAIRLAAPITAAPHAPPLLSLALKAAACGSASRAARGVAASAWERPDDYRIAITPAPLEALDAGFLGAAWAFGAWDVARTERLPLPAGSEPLDPRHGIAHLLHDPYVVRFMGAAAEPMPCPVDAAAWAAEAAAGGWITWLCKPIWYGPEIRAHWIARDSTLRQDGGRDPRARPWHASLPVARAADHQTVIRLGREAAP